MHIALLLRSPTWDGTLNHRLLEMFLDMKARGPLQRWANFEKKKSFKGRKICTVTSKNFTDEVVLITTKYIWSFRICFSCQESTIYCIGFIALGIYSFAEAVVETKGFCDLCGPLCIYQSLQGVKPFSHFWWSRSFANLIQSRLIIMISIFTFDTVKQ